MRHVARAFVTLSIMSMSAVGAGCRLPWDELLPADGGQVAEYHTEDGQVVIEAEDYSSMTENWELLTTIGTGVEGEHYPTELYSGDGYMRAIEDVDCDDYPPLCGQLDYWINFNEEGIYYLHVRTATWPPGQNSFKLAVDGEKLYNQIEAGRWDDGLFRYTTRCDGGLCFFNIDTPGLHTVSIGRRMPHVCFDLLWLSMTEDAELDREVEFPNPDQFLGP
jgi:hypothetical protein